MQNNENIHNMIHLLFKYLNGNQFKLPSIENTEKIIIII
jgi:hypothetical protein